MIELEENKTYVVCPICNEHKRELGQHIKKHKLTTDEFLKLYPGTQLCCSDQLELKKIGQQKTGLDSKEKAKVREEEYNKNPQLCKQCYKPLSYDSENDKMFCNSICAGIHSSTNRKHTEQSKEKVGETLKKYYKSEEYFEGKVSKIKYVHCRICNKLMTKREDWNTSKNYICSDKCWHDVLCENGRKAAKHNDGHHPSKKKKYMSKIYGEIFLDSKWENKMMKILESNLIYWIKPKPIPWIDKTGKIRKYYSDFFIPALNFYIETKNPWLLKKRDKYKMEYILNHVHNLVLIIDENNIKLEYILDFIKNKSL